jgi:hypothetical protein
MKLIDEDMAFEVQRQCKLDSACDAPDKNISISATAEALVALEAEIKQLEVEEERLATKRKYVNQKLMSCHAAIKKLLLATGAKYEAKVWPRYPELNGG